MSGDRWIWEHWWKCQCCRHVNVLFVEENEEPPWARQCEGCGNLLSVATVEGLHEDDEGGDAE